MDSFYNILLIVIIFFVLYYVVTNITYKYKQLNKFSNQSHKYQKNIKNKNKNIKNKNKNKNIKTLSNIPVFFNDSLSLLSYDSNNDNNNNDNNNNQINICVNKKVNSELLDVQYHKDYYDTINAINNLTTQKELFNNNYLPVIESKPPTKFTNQLVDFFMKKINYEIQNNVDEFRHHNSGWNDLGRQKRIKSGFEQGQEDLGLPGNLYNEPASKDILDIIKIESSDQLLTNEQMRIIITIVAQKKNVQDQIILKIVFFFDDMVNRSKMIINDNYVIIEKLFINGFLTDSNNNGNVETNTDKFYSYDNIDAVDEVTCQSKIIKQLIDNKNKRKDEFNSFSVTMDLKEQEQHDLDDIFSKNENTRDIIDDLQNYPQTVF